ncbi:patatin-like phospholipase family protein [Larkinella sp. GY13]|uniref:patatin-like phospholipase family protein n=1 Tax=Larkinella sp. GY13 TaxID=3453720 RepID=UPI003EE906FB
MDAVMDLTARAVAFITVAQDISYSQKQQRNHGGIEQVILLQHPDELLAQLKNAKEFKPFRERISELIKQPDDNPLTDFDTTFSDWLQKMKALLNWLSKNQALLYPKLCYSHVPITEKSIKAEDRTDPYPAPQQWRLAIRQILYTNIEERFELVKALDYLPVLIKLAYLGTSDFATQQTTKVEELLSNNIVLELLKNDDLLVSELINKQIPLPFESIYRQELSEIIDNREDRKIPFSSNALPNDPLRQAEALHLRALAFSGGGIRSATFNLGVLQGLAKAGLLPNFDYLSTVSGGGYIGAWYTAWIKRDGILLKVQDRLNPEKTTDPRGEELRPLRWLRMFSNYLAPSNNIMSTDSWTVGVTWLRNTLLNQVIILLLVISVLLAGLVGYIFWSRPFLNQHINEGLAFKIFSSLLFVGALLAGIGMGGYRPDLYPGKIAGSSKSKLITLGIIILGFLTAFQVSSWFFYHSKYFHHTFLERFELLFGIFWVGTIALLIVALFGRYDTQLPGSNWKEKIIPVILVIIFSGLSALFGVLLLTVAWGFIQDLAHNSDLSDRWDKIVPQKRLNWPVFFQTKEFRTRLAFVIGPPLVLEVLSLTVVMRMALLGKYFPDARREWWGRIGAIIHRSMLMWIVLCSIGLLGAKLIETTSASLLASLSGSWIAVVGYAVRLAYSSDTPSPKTAPKTFTAKGKDILTLIAPYLFLVGLLIIATKLIFLILKADWFQGAGPAYEPNYSLIHVAALFLGSTLLTFALAWRVGVNEFSMHHFYRNRLMRSYLAATRRRTDREKTANAFTGFDDEDDLKLCLLRNSLGYHGPIPIINTTLNASQVSETDLDRQDRKGESFIFTPIHCGFDISPTRPANQQSIVSNEYGYRPTEFYAYKPKKLSDGKTIPGGPYLSTAMSISGAAASPNQGAHSSPVTAFLMTVFNARLGWWLGNPRGEDWQHSDPRSGLAYLIYDLISKTSTSQDFVCLSDGGHFDNMGLYELIRRRVRLIILGDAEQDNQFTCEGLANAIRRCRVDFGVEITIDVNKITHRNDKPNFSTKHYALGEIWYPEDQKNQPSGRLIYLKSSLTKDIPVDIREYAIKNPDFPHQSTADQFFNEPQFESYRRLGMHVLETALADKDIRSLL